MESIATTYAKAIDELSGKIFIPALICSLFAEVGPIVISTTILGFWSTYILLALLGLILAPLILYLLLEITIPFFKGYIVSDIIGLIIMPLGFAGLFSSYFGGLEVPYTQITGVAILAWSFMLVRHSNFLNKLKQLT